MSDYNVTSDERKMEPLTIDPNAVADLLRVTKIWANLTQFEHDLHEYDVRRQESMNSYD